MDSFIKIGASVNIKRTDGKYRCPSLQILAMFIYTRTRLPLHSRTDGV